MSDELDLLDPALHATGDAARALDAQRDRCPVAWRAGRRGPGYWAVTGHAELAQVARDASTFSSYWGTRPEVRRTADAARPLHNLDAPEHAALRAIATSLVAPARLGALAATIEGTVTTAIDAFVAVGGGDALAALAIAVPAQIFAAWLGVADATALAARVERVHAAGAALLDAPTDAHRAAARDATHALTSPLRDAITAPAGGVLAELHAHVAAGTLALDEATMLAALLVEAGLPTTIDALASCLAALPTRPPDLALAIEEVLRTRSPIQQFARTALHDVTLAGADIRAGQQLVLWYGAANRDPRVFSHAATFDPSRAPNPHVAFGAGPHRCLGARFARDMLRAFFAHWFTRVARAEAIAERRASSYMHGYRALRIAITACT